MDASAFTCIPCEKVFTGPEPFRLHVASAKHKRKILAGSFVCEDCRMTFNGPAPLRDHMASERHAKKARVSSASDAVASAQCSSDGAGVVASNAPEHAHARPHLLLRARRSGGGAHVLAGCGRRSPTDG
ncbi:uncharacterized protein LOC144163178 isoform X2 [Haemaphysalis longicornis]